MKLKSIYNKDGVLTYEYFVNESDKDEIIKKTGLDESLSEKLGELLTNVEEDKCIFRETNTSFSITIGNVIITKDGISIDNSAGATEPTPKSYKTYGKIKKYPQKS